VEPRHAESGGQLPHRAGRPAAGRGWRGGAVHQQPVQVPGGLPERLGPALELGRSFIRAEYQRKPTSLALLWRGIGEYLVRIPRYKVLFGPVSISRDYADLSRRLMVEFLASETAATGAGRAGQGQEPAQRRAGPRGAAGFAAAGQGRRRRLRRWCRRSRRTTRGCRCCCGTTCSLNARLLSFNVDPAFGHCIDGLIVVDLRTTEPKILKRFMGEQGHMKYALAT
jgi:hypothetical protein